MPRKAVPKVDVELHLAFFVGPVNTESEHLLSHAKPKTVNEFKKYIKTEFTEMLEEEYNAAHEDDGDSITKKTAKIVVAEDRIHLTLKLRVKTSKTIDEVKTDILRMVQAIGQKSIDQKIVKDPKTQEDFQVNSFIKVDYAGPILPKVGGTKRNTPMRRKNKTQRSNINI
jgi:hypothetical protein